MENGHAWVGSDRQFFAILTKVVFVTGFSRMVVERRWDAFRAAFADFAPDAVAAFDEVAIERLLSRDSMIVRNARKVRATVANAAVCVELSRVHQSLEQFCAVARELGESAACRLFRQTFAAVGESAAAALWKMLYEGQEFRESPRNRFL